MKKETTPWAIMAGIAASHIGEHEESKNQSPFLKRIWNESGIGNWGYMQRQPWCATFVAWCIIEAGSVDARLERPFSVTASVAQFVERATSARIPHVRWRDARKGDIVTFLPHLSHIGIVEEVTAGGLVTIEGNTDGSGGREGDGVYRRTRAEGIIGVVWALPVGLGVAP